MSETSDTAVAGNEEDEKIPFEAKGSEAPYVFLDGSVFDVEEFPEQGRLGRKALARRPGEAWKPAEIVECFESAETEALCKNAFMADGPREGALLYRFADAGWTAGGKYVQVYEGSLACRKLDSTDFGPTMLGVSFNEIVYELLEALRELHSRGFVHAGIHPGAIITDGLTRSVSEYWTLHSIEGVPFHPPLHEMYPACLGAEAMLFCAPELYGGAAPSPASDIYSLGASLLYILTGQHHILRDANEDYRDVLAKLIEGKCPWLDEPSRAALALMLVDSPEQRSDIAFLMDLLYPPKTDRYE